MKDRPGLAAAAPVSVLDALSLAVAEQARALRHHARDARKKKGDADAVHDARVATRRLRAAFRSVKSEVRAPRPVRRGLRRLAKRLGRVRDQDVMLALLEQPRLPANGVEHERLERLVRHLKRRRAKAHATLRRWLKGGRYERLLHRLDEVAEHPRARHAEFLLASRVLAEVAASLGHEVAQHPAMTEADPAADALHELRIRFRRLRDALDLHAATCGMAYDVERRMAGEMQQVLGEIHDRDLALGWLLGDRKPWAGRWPALSARLRAERVRLMRRFRRLRREWVTRTRPEPAVAATETPRFVNLEVQRVGLRLVTGRAS
jgi:CHAD domain-containing protein